MDKINLKKENYINSLVRSPICLDRAADEQKALVSLSREYAKQNKNPETDFILGYFSLLEGDDYNISKEQALKYIQDASDAGHDEATVLLADIYMGGYDYILRQINEVGEYEYVTTDHKKPSRGYLMLEKMAMAGHPHALFLFAEYYGTDESLYDEEEDIGEKPALQYRDACKAIEYIDKCIKAGFIGGYYLKGIWLYSEDYLGPYDQEQAVKLWEEAYENVDIKDLFSISLYHSLCYALGYAYMEGEGCEQDKEKGMALVKKAADSYHEDARAYLAHLENSDSPMKFFADGKNEKRFVYTYDEECDGEYIHPDYQNFEKSNGNFVEDGNGYYTINHPEDEYKPPIRVRIHFPEEKNEDYKNFFDLDEQQQDKLMSDLLEPIDRLPGLISIKDEVRDMVDYALIKMKRAELGLKTKHTSAHMLFLGNPGTGKTIIARLLGNIFYQIGALEEGHVVEADSSTLVGEYVGWSASKTSLACNTALDGILFIDEAYSLMEFKGSRSDSGATVVNTLMKFMEDFSDRVIVIAAGYKDKMENFIVSNPGLRSRFSRTIDFQDYVPEDMVKIFHIFAEDHDYVLTDDAEKKLFLHLKSIKGNDLDRFANARGVRNLFDKTIKKQSKRLLKEKDLDKEKMMQIIADDIPSDKTVTDGNVSYLPTDRNKK